MIFTTIVIILIIAASNVNKIMDVFDDGPDKVGVVTSNDDIYKAIQAQGKQMDDDTKFKKVTEKGLFFRDYIPTF